MSKSSESDSAKPNLPARKRRRRKRRSKALALIRSYQKADWTRTIGGFRQGVPSLGISLAAHFLILLIMGWFVIRNHDNNFAPLELGWSTVVESDEQEPAQILKQPIVIPSISINSNPESARTTLPVEKKEEPPQQQSQPTLKLRDVSNSLRLRKQKPTPQKGDGAGAKKGTGREAIQKALRWIAKQQETDGRWRLNGDYADAGTIETDTGATALALLALLGDGHTHLTGDYQTEVQKGLDWLQAVQRENGDFFDILEQGREAHFYSHSQATIVLCEALALTHDESLRAPAERAVHFLEAAQNPVLGGWKYRPLNDDGIGDLSVTGWVLMALHSARMAEIEVELNTFFVAERFLNSVQEQPSTGAYYKYRPDLPITQSQRHPMTAEGLLCRQWLGWPEDHLPLRNGVKFLLAQKNLPEWKPRRRNVYAWYYTAQVLHNIGGEDWENWFGTVLPLIVTAQQRAGRDKGSWHPRRPEGAFLERSHDAGRLYLTVMCVLILETPSRHAPLYEEE